LGTRCLAAATAAAPSGARITATASRTTLAVMSFQSGFNSFIFATSFLMPRSTACRSSSATRNSSSVKVAIGGVVAVR
jgi:hypothetical protein